MNNNNQEFCDSIEKDIGPPPHPSRCQGYLSNGDRCPCKGFSNRTDLDPDDPMKALCGTPIGIHGVCGHKHGLHFIID